MGLFQSKQQSKKKSPADDASEEIKNLFDERYREELRSSGRAYFEKVINDNAAFFKQDLDATIDQINADLTAYMTKRLDATFNHIDDELTKQLDERLSDYDKLTKDAHDQAVQSLNRNAHDLHEKYEQLSQDLQQTVARHDVMTVTVFEENKARVSAIQSEQDAALKSLKEGASVAEQRSAQLAEAFEKTATDQEALLQKVFEDSKARVAATKDAQDKALEALNASAQALEQQHQQLARTLQQAVANQEAMVLDVFQNNMAQIIEHYLLGALGDQFDMKAQLPLIIKQMEQNKQAMMDDMKL